MKKTIYNPALRETITFNRTSAETNGAYSELQISLEPGGGNPLHIHNTYAELFTAIEGQLGMELQGGKKIYLQPGESFLVEIGAVHRFFNPGSKRITFLNRVTPGSTGLENTLRILCGLATDGLYNKKNIPKNIYHLAVCGQMSDMRLTGIMGFITSPIISTFAAIAKKNGIENELIEKYCV